MNCPFLFLLLLPPPSFEQTGVRWASLGMAINSFIVMITGLSLGNLTDLFGMKPVYFVTQLLAGICFIAPVGVAYLQRTPALVLMLILMGAAGFNFATMNGIPYALLPQYIKSDSQGLIMGIMNCFAVSGQTLSNLLAGSLVNTLLKNKKYGIASAGVGGLICK